MWCLIISCDSSVRVVSSATLTAIRIVVPPIDIWLSFSSAIEKNIGITAMIPRNIAPTRDILERTLWM